MKILLTVSLLAISIAVSPNATAQTPPPIHVAIVGLVHGHVAGFLNNLPAHPEIQLVGISEPDAALRQQYINRTHLPATIFFPTEAAMLQSTHPQAILVYTSTAGHRAAIEQAAPLHIAAMVEKPLATTVEDALAIQRLSEKYNVPVLTNYETTWYNSNTAAANILSEGKIGDLRKLVIHDGHEGPKEIGVSPAFLSWLTDPKQNGAGALFDFGCYGVDLATWIMHGELPLTVTAVTLHIKPQIYPNVDDDSTVVLTYPHAQAIIQGSWNWPFDRKDMEVYGATGSLMTIKSEKGLERTQGEKVATEREATPLAPPEDGSLDYLFAVLNGTLKPQGDLTAVGTNGVVMEIL